MAAATRCSTRVKLPRNDGRDHRDVALFLCACVELDMLLNTAQFCLQETLNEVELVVLSTRTNGIDSGGRPTKGSATDLPSPCTPVITFP
jgi:hypothetical protein